MKTEDKPETTEIQNIKTDLDNCRNALLASLFVNIGFLVAVIIGH